MNARRMLFCLQMQMVATSVSEWRRGALHARGYEEAFRRKAIDVIRLVLWLAIPCGWLPTVLAAGAAPAPEAAWADNRVTDDGITMASRRIPGTGFYEVRACCVVDAAPQKVFHVAMQRETYENSTKHVTEYRVVGTEGENVWYTYERLSFPLIRDRDYTLRYESRRDPPKQQFSIAWTLANDRGPLPKKGVIRVSATHGTLELTPEDGGKKTLLVCTMFADPGGWIPNWLVNYVNRSTVPDMLRLIRTKSTASK
jgi:hypothetical protein